MTCAKLGCTNPAAWHPCLLIYPPARYNSPVPIQSILSIGICTSCKDASKLEDFLGDEGWRQITDQLAKMGLVAPDRKLTKLAWRKAGEFAAVPTIPVEFGPKSDQVN
jgi:hypothetical protein